MKKIISVFLIFSICTMYIVGVSFASVSSIDELEAQSVDTLIEVEEGYIQRNTMVVYPSNSASGKACAIAISGEAKNPVAEYIPDITYKVNIPSDGYYSVYLRYNADNSGNDSVNCKWDNDAYLGLALPILDSDKWGWKMIIRKHLSAGEHYFHILRREASTILDAFVVTASSNFDSNYYEEIIAAQPDAPEEIEISEAAQSSSGAYFELRNDYVRFEAEGEYKNRAGEMVSIYNPTWYTEYSDSDASGGKGVYPAKDGRKNGAINPELEASYGIEFNFKAPAKGGYSIWIRTRSHSDSSIFTSVDGASYQVRGMENTYKSGSGNTFMSYDNEWIKIISTKELKKNSIHNVRIGPREMPTYIDQIVIVRGTGKPAGIGGTISISHTDLPSVYPMPTITPPPSHPRLYFTQDDIPTIRENMTKEQNQYALSTFRSYLVSGKDGTLGRTLVGSYNTYNSGVAAIVEAYAFAYAIGYDYVSDDETVSISHEQFGQMAVNGIKNYLSSVEIDPSGQDATRPIGHVVFLTSQVYDWCHDLISESDKEYLIECCENLASTMETGWPPSKQGAVTGHAGEAQIMRDLLGFGIATYDERPDIYNYVAGRFLSQFLEPRNYWYKSATHHQGSSYGIYRNRWEIVAQLIYNRMTGGEVRVFDDTQADVPYFWIYSRRGDGQFMRTGDSYDENNATSSFYHSANWSRDFMVGNFYKDPILKGEYNISNYTLSNSHGELTAVFFLLFNDPDFEGIEDKSSLPLSRYFASPNGMMIARTGWNMNPDNPADNDDVVAMMKIGERYAANHDHLDRGNFQIYYKGILASESGYYESYGTLHDSNYNKATIAHNTLTIYDPSEVFRSYNGTDRYGNGVYFANVNDGGQQNGNGRSEPSTWEMWGQDGTDGNYDMGTVLAHEIGPDEMNPEYTYISGNITKAYTHKSNKVSEVKRSMVFMPLDDENYPAMMVVMDRVSSTNPSFKKTWMIHMQYEPEIDTSTKTSVITNINETMGYNGKLTLQTLLPKNAVIEKIGGDGKRYWIGNNLNYNFDTISDVVIGGGNEAGWGRIEVSPAQDNITDRFLNVMAVSDGDNTAAPLDSQLIESDKLVGVKTGGKVVMFSDLDTSSEMKRCITDNASFTVGGSEESLDILITGVKPGKWRIRNKTKGQVILRSASEDGGALYFEGGVGEYEIEYLESGNTIKNVTLMGGKYAVVELDGSYAGSKLFVVSYDDYNGISEIKTVECSDKTMYNIPISSDINKMKIFIWNGLGGLQPIGSVYEINQQRSNIKNKLRIYNSRQSGDDGSGNVISNSYDGSLETRWAPYGKDGDAWGIYDLDEVYTINDLYMAWYNGTSRIYYFDIELSEDGESWTKVIENGQSSGTSVELEKFSIGGVKARYIKYIGGGNTTNLWNSLTEIVPVGTK